MPASDVYLSAEYGELKTSNDASLSSIIIYSSGDETARSEIIAGKTEYTVTVPHQTETIQILAKTQDIQAVPVLDGGREFLEDIQLSEGANRFEITVTSSDNNAAKNYTLIVKRAPDLSLSVLRVEGADIDSVYINKNLDIKKTAPQALTVTERNVIIKAEAANPDAEITGDIEAFTVNGLQYQQKKITVTAVLDGDEYRQDYIINVCYSANPNAEGLSYRVELLNNYVGAAKDIYRAIIVPIIGDNGGGDISTLKEGLEEASAEITRPLYQFEGWYTGASGGVKFDPETAITTSMSLYARWKANEYKLTFNYNYPKDDPNKPEEPPPVVKEGSSETTFTPPDDPEQANYNFTGWYTGEGVAYTPTAKFSETRTVYARWAGKNYTVKFNAGEGANPPEQSVLVTYPAQVNAPQYTPVKSGSYGFTGWFTGVEDGNGFEPYIPVSDGGVFYARWEAGVATLTLNSNYPGGAVKYETPPYNGTVNLTAGDVPSREHYIFAGWRDDSYGGNAYGGTDGIHTINNYTGTPAVLYAHWTIEKCAVNFYKNTSGGDNELVWTTMVDYGSTVALPELPGQRAGYAAKGWYPARSSGEKILPGTVITANKDFYVQWLYYTSSIPANASGGDIKYVSTDDGFDEIHTFKSKGTLNFNAGYLPSTSRWLVVGGGGGAGGANFPSSGGGAGRMMGHDSYKILAASYSITVGSGGDGGSGSNTGKIYSGGLGGASKVESGVTTVFSAPGGGSGGAHDGSGNCGAGEYGGSSGGGGGSIKSVDNDNYKGTYPSGGFSYGNAGGYGSDGNNYAGGGGGAGENGSWGNVQDNKSVIAGGKGSSNDITGSSVTYAAGGSTAGNKNMTYQDGASAGNNTGNGGQGAWNGKGGSGGSGVVIVRFPYKYMGN
jgi:uncharacterized repeat protein (TIGR02543 family)